jgi:predicted enzyme related to lactoylglutathione lyase
MVDIKRPPPNGGYRAPTSLELSSHDPKSTQQFLEVVFGWNFAPPRDANGDGLSFRTSDGVPGHIWDSPAAEPPDHIDRVRVADVGIALLRAQQAGARLLLPRVDAPGMGSFFAVEIPGGPILTIWQTEPRDR